MVQRGFVVFLQTREPDQASLLVLLPICNMMLLPKSSSALSARARDALHYFWVGMERMSGENYFR